MFPKRTQEIAKWAFGIVFAFASFASDQVRAADQPNVMIMGEDADRDTVPRNSRIFNRVNDAIRSRMMDLGFKVYNETATTMDITNPSRVRRTDAELISVAQNMTSAPIDVITMFQIYAGTQQNAYSDIRHLTIRIVGRMLQVQTGRDLGNFEVSVGPKGLTPLPVKCNRDCVLEHVGNEAKPIANEVGVILARKLDQISHVSAKPGAGTNELANVITTSPTVPPSDRAAIANSCAGLPTAYTIVLTGFAPGSVQKIEEMLFAFQGYQHHRPIKSQTLYSEYWYETCSDRARLERNLRTMSDLIQGQNRITLNGNKFELEHIPDINQRN